MQLHYNARRRVHVSMPGRLFIACLLIPFLVLAGAASRGLWIASWHCRMLLPSKSCMALRQHMPLHTRKLSQAVVLVLVQAQEPQVAMRMGATHERTRFSFALFRLAPH